MLLKCKSTNFNLVAISPRDSHGRLNFSKYALRGTFKFYFTVTLTVLDQNTIVRMIKKFYNGIAFPYQYISTYLKYNYLLVFIHLNKFKKILVKELTDNSVQVKNERSQQTSHFDTIEMNVCFSIKSVPFFFSYENIGFPYTNCIFILQF